MNPTELASFANTVNILPTQLAQAQKKMESSHKDLQLVRSAYCHAQGEISQLKNQMMNSEPEKPKPRKPMSFTG